MDDEAETTRRDTDLLERGIGDGHSRPAVDQQQLALQRRQSRGLFRGGWDDVAFCVLNCNKMVAVISEDQNNDPNSNGDDAQRLFRTGATKVQANRQRRSTQSRL